MIAAPITRFVIFAVLFFPVVIYADNLITINKGNVEPIAIAINKFATTDFNSPGPANNPSLTKNIAELIGKIITDNLKNSGIFRPISPHAFIENKIGIDHAPLFAAWQQINASLLLNGEVIKLPAGKIQVKFGLWDTVLEKQMVSGAFELTDNLARRAAHKISDQIYKAITGYDGYFDTRVVYVAESGPYLKRKKRIAIMDQDGANHQYLTNGSDLVLTPRFSPDAKSILYLSYKNRLPQVHILNLKTGQSSLVGNFKGMSFAPRFAPDGKYALMSIAKNGATHIYEINLTSKKMTQLTSGQGIINTSPSYSPDGTRIVFNSNEDGSRQLYIMNRDGSNKRKISSGSGAYAEPVWSSDNYIAFTKISKTHGFTIGVIKADDTSGNERLIAKGYLVESPTWASNGRIIMYTKGNPPNIKGTNLNKIYTVDFNGYNERMVPTPQDASDPNWSSLLN